MPAPEPPFKRFHRGFVIDKDTDCWLWSSSKYKNGYGWIKVFGQVTSAHRFSYELYNGAIPDGMEILHSCDVKHCVNPSHLRAGTHAENMKEAVARNRFPSGSKHHMHGKKNPRPKQANRVLVLGVEYESQNAAARALGLGHGTVLYWLKNRPDKARLLGELK